MKTICEKEQCTGCGLCAARCPKQCISMKSGRVGHLYPKINQAHCIDCGLCKRGCPSLHEINAEYPIKAFAAWAKDFKEYKSSTSGGAAAVFSRYILQNKGVVYGCSVLPGSRIEHIRIDKTEDLPKLKGSKYVQSDIRKCIPFIKRDVKDGRTVLFIGTPCQVAGIKQMFKTVPNNLFLVDLICHGTPSAEYLRYYMKDRLHIDPSQVTEIKFRLPDAYALTIISGTNTIFQGPNLWTHRYEEEYFNLFIDGYTYRESCYQCHYAKPQRISDITIGDFWGLGAQKSADYIPTHEEGISCILPITEKGLSLINKVKNQLNIFERPVEEALNGNAQLREPKYADKKIRFFQFWGLHRYMFALYKILNFRQIYHPKHIIKALVRKCI